MDFTRPNATATCDPRHLAALLGVEQTEIEQGTVHVYGNAPANAQAIIDSYVYDPGWRPTISETDWRAKLQAEIDFLTTQASSFPANPTAAQVSVAIKRLARDLIRILKFIRDDVLDSGNS